MKHKLKTADGRALYAKRKCTIEPLFVFGIIKHVMGFRQFLLRGFKAVTGEWTRVSIAWNIKRMFALNI
ncbi:MAG: transposase [Proteobacteria bacterium]|nr:transposase [Pseudomonadota bacterium]MBU4296558.1 transposase [Pseudomonadota bacterium]